MKPRRGKDERSKLLKALDDVCRNIIRLRDGNQCQMRHHCSGGIIKGSNSQPCHVIAKGHGASWRRFDLLNIFLGCNPCHRWWHDNPIASATWYLEKWPHRAQYLDEKYTNARPAKITTPEMRDLLIEHKEKLAQLESEFKE